MDTAYFDKDQKNGAFFIPFWSINRSLSDFVGKKI